MDCLIISDGHTAKYSNHLFDHLEAQVRWIQLSPKGGHQPKPLHLSKSDCC